MRAARFGRGIACALAGALAGAMVLRGAALPRTPSTGSTGSIPSRELLTASRQPPSERSGVPCSARTAGGHALRDASTTHGVSTPPFGVASTRSGRFVFVGLSNAVGVFARTGDRLRPISTITLPQEARGVALSPDGRYLLVADGNGGAYVLDAAAAERGSRSALLGQLSSTGNGAVEVAISPDGRFAFVTLEDSDALVVFNLKRAVATRFTDYGPLRLIGLGRAPVGVAFSPTGRYLYATSEVSRSSPQGSLTTIDVAGAESGTSRAVVSSVDAGCIPVRVAVAGRSAYVTARGSNAVLWFSTQTLVRSPARAFRGSTRVGSEPVGLVAVDEGRRLLVADSNRFGAGRGANLALLRLGSGGRPRLAGYLRSGAFPRDVAADERGDVAVVADYASSQLQVVSLPWRTERVGSRRPASGEP